MLGHCLMLFDELSDSKEEKFTDENFVNTLTSTGRKWKRTCKANNR